MFGEIRIDDHNHPISDIFEVEVISKLNRETLVNTTGPQINLSTIQRIRQNPHILNHHDFIVLFETPTNIEQLPLNNEKQVLFIGNSAPQSMMRFFGEPIYQYTLEEAIKDEYLKLPEVISLDIFQKNEPVNIQAFGKVLPQIIGSFDRHKKVLVVCKNSDDAQRVYELFQESQYSDSFKEINLITSRSSNNNIKIKKFTNESGPQITISVKALYHGYEINGVTDIILLKHFTSSRELIDATKLILRTNSLKQKKVIWDLYSNKGLTKLFGEPIRAFNKGYNPKTTSKSEKYLGTVEELFENNRLIKPNGDSVSNTDYLNRDYLINTLKGLIEHSSENTQHKPFVFWFVWKMGYR